MDSEPDCYVSGPLGTVLYISKFTGIAPLQFVREMNGWRIRLSTRHTFLRFIIPTILYIIQFYGIVSAIQFEKIQMDQYVWLGDILTTALLFGTVFNSKEQMQYLIDTVNEVQQINIEFNNIYWPMPWTRLNMFSLISWGIFNVFVMITFLNVVSIEYLTTHSQLPGRQNVGDLLFRMTSCCCNLVIQLGLIQFVCWVLFVNTSFKTINCCLRNLLRESKEEHDINNIKFNNFMNTCSETNAITLDSAGSSCLCSTLRRVSSSFVRACAAVRAVNQCCGLMLFMLFTNSFLHLIIIPYYIFTGLFTHMYETSDALLLASQLMAISWTVYYLVNLALCIEPCHRTHSEMEITRKLVSDLIQRSRSANDPLTNELEQLYKYTLNDFSYKPLNIFKISRSVALVIAGSITTYLVILIDAKKNESAFFN